MQTIAFDIYGTLINPMALGETLHDLIGEKSVAFNTMWRDKQLEYSFRLAAMKRFNHFSECTRMGLEYCDKYFQTKLDASDIDILLGMYKKLPAYSETLPCLEALSKKGIEIFAFSNGKKEDLKSLFNHAGITEYFDRIISVDEVRTFKPSPEVYNLLASHTKSDRNDIWLISSNSFDIIGAGATGLKTVWIKHKEDTVFDPFGIAPTHIIHNLSELSELFN